ncbi:SDR family oxidoreductase [Kutzneria viridogrisea]|uniref:NAD-dependent epimerase/dehydratase domain-containing protein n=2 Tax=Kutzneria TaxID=43356 RepID=W5WL27_9PSEU|nr:NAD-dependent epimerase/dehydratase family protein [Kutzneria albida]AHI01919.1 hypothetical protein KALB_8562 [Kutzneria albida DSM 43870]MBA8929659.1 nucleoside-diphosphate-sugar epimerase [Kutzneria viridogrisea]
MRVLVLGGTVFVSWAVAEEALRRGHEVVCAARGTSGQVPAGARLVRVDRDDPAGLAPLAGERFDAVVDVAKMSYPWVRDALAALGAGAGHWTFVSTINVYADEATKGLDARAALREPLTAEGGEQTPENYGAIKVASEEAVRDAVGDRAFVVRPGLITGPKDDSDRFGYWPGRMARGGQVLVPDAAEQLVQYVDVRDLAAWIVDAAEQRLVGDFDAVCPAQRLGDLLAGIAELAAPAGTELVPVSPEVLTANGVQPWGGPRSLPLWLPAEYHGIAAREVSASLAAGLRPRPLDEVVSGALGRERELGLDRERRAGLSRAAEAEVLAAARA